MVVEWCESHTKFEKEFNFCWPARKFGTHNYFYRKHVESNKMCLGDSLEKEGRYTLSE